MFHTKFRSPSLDSPRNLAPRFGTLEIAMIELIRGCLVLAGWVGEELQFVPNQRAAVLKQLYSAAVLQFYPQFSHFATASVAASVATSSATFSCYETDEP